MNARYVIGLDAGTTSFKAALFDENLNLIAERKADYTLLTPRKSFVEYRPDDYYAHARALIRALATESGVSPKDIKALSISSQGETLICLDAYSEAVGNAIVWTDNRAESEADELRRVFPRKLIYETTGQAEMTATWPAAKILWLKHNERGRFDATRKFMLLEDYLIYRLTGVCAGEPNLWASSALINIHDNSWWRDMLEYVGIDESRLPDMKRCGSIVGHVSAAASAETGLSSDTLIIAGALDQTCNAIGAGITRAGTVCETTGSCLAVSAITDVFPPFDEGEKLTCQNSAVDGRYTTLLWSQSAGMTLKWFAREFYKEFHGDTDAAFIEMNKDALHVPAGSGGIIALPHLSGASNPEYDPNATGVFFGATLSSGRAHFTRSIMESVAYMLRRNLEQLERLGVKFDCVYCMGGAAKSPVWLQIKADVAKKEMRPLRASESACRGAAILALVGAGLRATIDSDGSIDALAAYEPNTENASAYDDGYEGYIELYQALRGMFKRGK